MAEGGVARLQYPPDGLTCHYCDLSVSSREKLENHYKTLHNVPVLWVCANCLSKTANKHKVMSSHFSRCKKKNVYRGEVNDGEVHVSAGTAGTGPFLSSNEGPLEPNVPEAEAANHEADTGQLVMNINEPCHSNTIPSTIDLADPGLFLSACNVCPGSSGGGTQEGSQSGVSAKEVAGSQLSRARWTDSELRALALLEVKHAGKEFINQAVAAEFTSRSLDAIRAARHQQRYKRVLAGIKASVDGGILAGEGNNLNIRETEVPSTQPLDPDSVLTDFREAGLNERMARAIVDGPLDWAMLLEIFGHYGVTWGKLPKGPRPKSFALQVPSGNKKTRKQALFREHQRLYSRGPKVLLDELLLSNEEGSSVSLNDVHDVYGPLFSKVSEPVETPLRGEEIEDFSIDLFSREELVRALKDLGTKSAAGPDGLVSEELKKVPPAVLLHIVNNWWHFKCLPPQLKVSRTVFVPKVVSPTTAGELRPISIGSILYRLFMRMMLWRFRFMRFHTFQSGFSNDKSTSTNLLLLQGLMKLAKNERRNFFAASLDIRKAFDTVSHHALIRALEGRGVPQHVVALMKEAYTGCTTTFWLSGKTDGISVPQRQGIKQGDPMSPLLFNAVLDPLLHALDSKQLGFRLGDGQLASLAFADDLVLVSDSYEGLQSMLREVEHYLRSVRLQLNPAKTQYFGWLYDGYNKWFKYDLPSISVDGVTIESRGRLSPIKYLGLELYCNRSPRVQNELAQQLITLIEKAALKPFQKLNCLRTVILPMFAYGVTNTVTWVNEGARLDKRMRGLVKKFLHLPGSFPSVHIWMPSRHGGLGVMNLERTAATVQYKAFARLYRMASPVVDHIINYGLIELYRRICKYLSLPEGITGKAAADKAVLSAKKAWEKRLKDKYTNQGLFAHDKEVLGNRWLAHDCKYLRDGDRISGLRLRTNLYPTKTLYNKKASNPEARLCSHCHQKDETAYHILQECERVHLPRVERHDFICRQITRILHSSQRDVRVRENLVLTVPQAGESPSVEGNGGPGGQTLGSAAGQRLKPDLIIEEGNTVFIVDCAIAWDASVQRLEEVARHKIQKYTPLRACFPEREVECLALVFGARSMTCASTKRTAQKLGLSNHDLAWLSSRVLVGSLICLKRFTRMV